MSDRCLSYLQNFVELGIVHLGLSCGATANKSCKHLSSMLLLKDVSGTGYAAGWYWGRGQLGLILQTISHQLFAVAVACYMVPLL